MKYLEFISMLNQEIDYAQAISRQHGMEEAIKALLFHGRSLSAEEKETEFAAYQDMVFLAEDELLKLSVSGRETLEHALYGAGSYSIEQSLKTQLAKLIKREEAQEIEEYRLPDSTLSSLAHLKDMSHYDYDKTFTEDEMLSLLRSVILSNSMHEAAGGLLQVSNQNELKRRRDRLSNSFFRDIDQEERRKYIAAALLGLRRRGQLPAELEAMYDGRPVLNDKALLMMFMCADDQMEEFIRTGKPDADWLGFICSAGAALLLVCPAIVFPAIMVYAIVEQIFPFLLAAIVAISMITMEILIIWALVDYASNAIACLKPEMDKIDIQAQAFDREMGSMARSLFDERRSKLNAVAAYAQNKADEVSESEYIEEKQWEAACCRE